ncbi:MAG: hypothetical protein R3191_04920 [Anaerolineales bacterium]|nr:hypothetical protein [Anaerolineales bacterium]
MFISHHHIKDGKLSELREESERTFAKLKGRDPGTALFEAYSNQAGDQITFVHIFVDGAAMASHLKGVDQRGRSAREYLKPIRFEIYGDPGAKVMQMMRKAAGEQIELRWKPRPFGGFHRYGSPTHPLDG